MPRTTHCLAGWKRSVWVALVAGCLSAAIAIGQAGAAQALPADVREALSLQKQGKAAEAAAAWKKVVARDPKNAQAYAQLGMLEAHLVQYDDAIAAYEEARRLKPGLPGLEMNYGLALFKSQRYAAAAAVLAEELKRHPEAPEAQRLTTLAGMAYYGARNYATAAGYLKTASAKDAQNLPMLLALGHCYLWTNQSDATMKVFRQILEIDPDSAEADMMAGEALDEKGDSAGAIKQFQAAIKVNPKEPQAHFGLAYILWTQKRYDEAETEFRAELANDAQNSLAMIYLADTYVRQSKYEPAKPLLEEAVRLKPEASLPHLNLGIVLMEGDEKSAAETELKKAIELDPENVAAHFRLAELYRGQGKKDEAKAEFARSKALTQKTDNSLFQRISEASAKPDPHANKDADKDAAKPQDVPQAVPPNR